LREPSRRSLPLDRTAHYASSCLQRPAPPHARSRGKPRGAMSLPRLGGNASMLALAEPTALHGSTAAFFCVETPVPDLTSSISARRANCLQSSSLPMGFHQGIAGSTCPTGDSYRRDVVWIVMWRFHVGRTTAELEQTNTRRRYLASLTGTTRRLRRVRQEC
jgi:hypothetical protein